MTTMPTRTLGRTSREVGIVGLGTWQLGADWGQVDDAQAAEVLHAALDAGVTFLDTADVYGDGRSEQRIAAVLDERGRPDEVMVATKAGRRADPHVAEAFTLEALRGWTDRSRRNLGVDRLDLVQLHCPPTAVFSDDRVFDALDTLVEDGALAAYGVSVETRTEALTAIARPGVASVQIILNPLRMAPVEDVLPAARAAGVGIIVRVSMDSGLPSERYTRATTFPADDHRTYNRHGEAFDVGETFAGVPFEVGIDAATEFASLAPDGFTPAQLALRWILDQPGVTTVIPGARSVEQVDGNVAAARLPSLDPDLLAALRDLYDRTARPYVHARW
jgi:aryl-alcohol dehydrogenase-like predicted oxidoreductase